MSNLQKRFPFYSRILMLYPKSYRQRYGEEMLQTTADMLDAAPSGTGRAAIWWQLTVDLPLSITRQQLNYIGEVMQTSMPNYVKRSGLVAGLLLVPFFVALGVNGLDKIITNHDLYSSWLWRSRVIGVWVLFLPALALLVAGTSYLRYVFKSNSHTRQPWVKRALDITRLWPLLITGLMALGILFLVEFHDSTQCWMQAPGQLASHLNQAWKCSESNQVTIPRAIEKTFKGN